MATYALGGVKANVRQAANEVGNRHGIKTILGVGTRSNASDHPKGLALDYMCDLATGDRVKADLTANWDRYGVKYLIHRQRIKESKNGTWTMMEDRGSPTANHMDHVHASFNNVAVNTQINNVASDDTGWSTSGDVPYTAPDGTSPGYPNPTEGIASVYAFVTDGNNWIRAALVVVGTILLAIVGYQLMNSSGNAIKKMVK